MEDQTGTPGFEDVGADSEKTTEQTATTEEQAAESETTEDSTDQTSETATTTDDDDDIAWAAKKGVQLDDKAAIAKMLRNADRKVTESTKTSLQEAVDKTANSDPDADVVTELQNKYRILENKFTAQQYYIDNPEDKQYDAEATAILTEEIEQDPDFARALGRNLPKLFALAKDRHRQEEVAAAEEKGRKDERKALAGKQRASATSQAATTQSPPETEDDFMKGFNNPW